MHFTGEEAKAGQVCHTLKVALRLDPRVSHLSCLCIVFLGRLPGQEIGSACAVIWADDDLGIANSLSKSVPQVECAVCWAFRV